MSTNKQEVHIHWKVTDSESFYLNATQLDHIKQSIPLFDYYIVEDGGIDTWNVRINRKGASSNIFKLNFNKETNEASIKVNVPNSKSANQFFGIAALLFCMIFSIAVRTWIPFVFGIVLFTLFLINSRNANKRSYQSLLEEAEKIKAHLNDKHH